MTDPRWNRSATSRLERSHSTSTLPALTSIQTPRIARQFFFDKTLNNQAESSLDLSALSNFVLQGSEKQSAHTADNSNIHSSGNSSGHLSKYDYDNQFDPEIHPHRHTVGATSISEISYLEDIE